LALEGERGEDDDDEDDGDLSDDSDSGSGGAAASNPERCPDRPPITDSFKRMLLERAAALDDAAACHALCMELIDPALFRKAVSLGHGAALVAVAEAYERKADADPAQVRQSYRRLEGLPVIWHEDCGRIWIKLGEAYETGESFMPKDLCRAAAMYARAVNTELYCHHLGRLLRDGHGVQRDLARARNLFALASENPEYVDRNVDAHLLLAYSCMHGGAGIDVDIPRAIKAFVRYFEHAFDSWADVLVMQRALWDFILLLLRSNRLVDAAAWSTVAFNRVNTIDLTNLDSVAACEALLALSQADQEEPSSRHKRMHLRCILLKALGLPTSGWESGEWCAKGVRRLQPANETHALVADVSESCHLNRLWVSRCGHVALDAIAAAAFSASGSCPRGCALGAPVTWTEMARPFLEPAPPFVSALKAALKADVALNDAVHKINDILRSMAEALTVEPALMGDSSLGTCSRPSCVETASLGCGRCGSKYCSPACQRAHWRDHRPACKLASLPLAHASAEGCS